MTEIVDAVALLDALLANARDRFLLADMEGDTEGADRALSDIDALRVRAESLLRDAKAGGSS